MLFIHSAQCNQAFKKCLLNRIEMFGQAGLISANLFQGRYFLKSFLIKSLYCHFLSIQVYAPGLLITFSFPLVCDLLVIKMQDLLLFNIWDLVDLIRDKKLLAKKKFIICLKISFVMIFCQGLTEKYCKIVFLVVVKKS